MRCFCVSNLFWIVCVQKQSGGNITWEGKKGEQRYIYEAGPQLAGGQGGQLPPQATRIIAGASKLIVFITHKKINYVLQCVLFGTQPHVAIAIQPAVASIIMAQTSRAHCMTTLQKSYYMQVSNSVLIISTSYTGPMKDPFLSIHQCLSTGKQHGAKCGQV